MKVALVFNVKAEASPTQLTPGQSQKLSAHESPLQSFGQITSASASFSPATDRSDDMYAEWDTVDTVNAVRAALEERYEVVMVEANEDSFRMLKDARPDFVFNMSEGLYGVSREAQIPAILEMLQLPYLGSDPLTLAVCLDKARAKEILSYHRIPTASFSVVEPGDDIEDVRVKFPAMAKPLHEGSSKGIYNSCVVRSPEELETEVRKIHNTYNEPALIEDFLPGREFTVALLGNGEATRVLPIVEIKFDALPQNVNRIYSYEAKWIWDQSADPLDIFECPAALDEPLKREIERICKDAYHVLRCRDWSRIDVRLDGHGNPHIIEINPLPGILPRPEDNSCFPKAARAAGMSYNQLINAVLDVAMQRCGVMPQVRQAAAEVA